MKKSVAMIAFAWEWMNADHVGPVLVGVGWRPASRRIFHTVDAATLWPSWASSPWMRR